MIPKRLSYTLLLLLLSSCATLSHEKETKMNTLQEQKTLAARYLDTIWNEGELEKASQWVSAGYQGQTQALDQPVFSGPSGLKTWVTAIRAAFPDGKKTIVSSIAEKDQVVLQVVFRGTYPKTGKKIESEQIHVLQFEGEQIISERVFFDVGGFLSSLAE